MGNPSYSVLQVALVISNYPLFPLRSSCEIINISMFHIRLFYFGDVKDLEYYLPTKMCFS